MSYSSAVDTVYSKLDAATFDFDLVPADYRGLMQNKSEFVSVQVLAPDAERVGYGSSGELRRTGGLVTFGIFTPVGEGPSRTKEIVTQIEKVFQDGSSPYVLFNPGKLVLMKQDEANEKLTHAEYIIQFTLFGEL
jgi:hypothetical protein